MNKYKVKVIGKKAKLRYFSAFWFGQPQLEKRHEDTEDYTFWVGEIDQPKLEKGDKIYVNSETIYPIIDIARNVDGGFVCWTDEVFEIEDEKTAASKIEAKLKIKEWKQKEKEERVQRESESATKNETNTKNSKWFNLFR